MTGTEFILAEWTASLRPVNPMIPPSPMIAWHPMRSLFIFDIYEYMLESGIQIAFRPSFVASAVISRPLRDGDCSAM